MPHTGYPFISIITPVHNGEKSIAKTLESFSAIQYPRDRLEIIIVNNKSTDKTPVLLKEYPFTILEESERLSSYAARNKGILHAKGELLAFTDADCMVTPVWLIEYLKYMTGHPVDLVVGRVEVIMSEHPNIYETYDRCKSLDQEFYVREFHFGATANLLVKRSVFEKIGMFDSSLISSGDLEFGQRAYGLGFKLGFCSEAIVYHYSRTSLRTLMKKQLRVGFGYAQIYFKYKIGYLFTHRWKLFLPNRDFLRFKSSELNFNKMQKSKFVLVDWLCNCAWIYGNIHSILKFKKNRHMSSS